MKSEVVINRIEESVGPMEMAKPFPSCLIKKPAEKPVARTTSTDGRSTFPPFTFKVANLLVNLHERNTPDASAQSDAEELWQ